MTNKYILQRYGDEFYIIDSTRISEKDFDEKLELEGYKAFEDSLTGEEIVKLLNENNQLKQENIQLDILVKNNQLAYEDLEKESILLKDDVERQRKHKMDCIKQANWLNKQLDLLQRENDLWKKENQKLKFENNRLVKETADTISENTKKTLELIDKKIEELETDLQRSVKAGMPTSSLYSEIELLEDLKKELSE